MTADKRNAVVVAALILALTGGAGVLLCLEPTKPTWQHATLLAAESEAEIREVEIHFAPTVEQASALIAAANPDATWVVLAANQQPEVTPGGPHVQLIVVGGEGARLEREQKEAVLATLHSLTDAGTSGQVHVYLAAESDVRRTADLPPQANDLLQLLERKRIID